ncbi:MAG: 1-phosphofructokinase [Friedmanniella sp.]|nr:1-phosphofructokinase [Friedmanniella sp.]
MIVTVTPNPSLDVTMPLERLTRGGVNRAGLCLREPSGKGVNVSLALHAAGAATVAVLPLGGPAGAELGVLLEATGVACRVTPIAGRVRSNLTLIEADGTTTKINEPGPRLDAAEVAGLLETAAALCAGHDWLALCGSLPDGLTTAALAGAVARARGAGLQVAVDTSDAPLLALVAGEGLDLPTVVKPNTHELATATGRSIDTLGEAAEAAAVLQRRGIGTVLVSMGGDGALLVDRRGALHGRAPVPRVVNTVGAGDAFLAGFLYAQDRHPGAREDALATALRWGAIAVQHPRTVFPGPGPASARPAVQLRSDFDVHQPLTEPAR